MKITNIHSRVIHQSKEKISQIFDTLASNDDQIWPIDKWPPMIFKNGLQDGAVGGHGPIRYSVRQYLPGNSIEFKFIQPDGFDGIHRFDVAAMDSERTEIKHTIEMTLSGKGILTWYIAIKWLHDALLEDCLDNVENRFLQEKMTTRWNVWVCILRKILKRK